MTTSDQRHSAAAERAKQPPCPRTTHEAAR
jgi:hypothetical protein